MEKAIRTYEEIMDAALALPPEEREMLAEHLMGSLVAHDPKLERLWAEEAERRNQEIEDGIVQPIPGEDVMRRLRSRYKR